MKKYYCTILERYGEFEFPCYVLIQSDNIEETFFKVCKNFRGEGVFDEELDFFDHAGNTSVDYGDSNYREISDNDFEVMKKYLSVLD